MLMYKFLFLAKIKHFRYLKLKFKKVECKLIWTLDVPNFILRKQYGKIKNQTWVYKMGI